MISHNASRLLGMMAKGAGKTSTIDIDLLKEALGSIGWTVTIGVGLYRITLEERLERHPEYQNWSRKWGIETVIAEPKVISFFFEEQENAYRSRLEAPFIVGTPPSQPVLWGLYAKRVLTPRQWASGSWSVDVEDLMMAVPTYTFTTANNVQMTVMPPPSREGLPNPQALSIPTFWSWGYKNGLQELAAKALTETPQEAKPLAPGERTLENTGTCGVCMQNVKLTSAQRVMRHGWQVGGNRQVGRIGYSWHTGPCFGVGYEPWEVSPKAADEYVKYLKGEVIPRYEKELGYWSNPPEEVRSPYYKTIIYFGGPNYLRDYPKFSRNPDPKDFDISGYPPRFRAQLEADDYALLKREIRTAYKNLVEQRVGEASLGIREATAEANQVSARIATWKPKDLRGKTASARRVAASYLLSRGRH